MINLLVLQYCQPLTLSKVMSQSPKSCQMGLKGISLSLYIKMGVYIYKYVYGLIFAFGILNLEDRGLIFNFSNFFLQLKEFQ